MAASDLLQTRGGELTPEMFPDLDATALATTLERWLQEGGARALPISDAFQRLEAAKHWAYYLAYTAVLNRLAAQDPASVSIDGEVSRTVTGDQLRAIQAQADRHRIAFEERMPSAVDPSPVSRTTLTVAEW
jgi:hypothetical protein